MSPSSLLLLRGINETSMGWLFSFNLLFPLVLSLSFPLFCLLSPPAAPFSPPGSETVVKFDSQGDGVGRYNIFSYQRSADRYGYVPVGDWAESLTLSNDLIHWPREVVPTSQCSDPCERNEMKKMQAGRRLNFNNVLFLITVTYRTEQQCLLKNHILLFVFLFPRWVLLLDLYSLRASWIPGWWVHLRTLCSWPVAHWWTDVLLRPSWGLHYVGGCLGHRSNYHRLCRVSDNGLSTWLVLELTFR